ncbi:MAG: hypothetical protein LBI69_02120 [Puniceicoccales bacterium]|jgi:hypothetical protein|nr:hypothetical protein [Puniceicoccales bacterium]
MGNLLNFFTRRSPGGATRTQENGEASQTGALKNWFGDRQKNIRDETIGAEEIFFCALVLRNDPQNGNIAIPSLNEVRCLFNRIPKESFAGITDCNNANNFTEFFENNAELKQIINSENAQNILMDHISAAIDKIPNNLHGFSGGARNYMDTHFKDIGRSKEIVIAFFNSLQITQKKIDANMIIGDDGSIRHGQIDASMMLLMEDPNFANDPKMQQLFFKLYAFESNNNLQRQLLGITKVGVKQLSNLMRLSTLFRDEAKLTDCELRRMVVDASLFQTLRQEDGVGSCFICAPLIALQANRPDMFMQLFIDIFLRDKLQGVSRRGVAIEVNSNFNEYNPNGKLANSAKSLHNMLARTVATLVHAAGYRDMAFTYNDADLLIFSINNTLANDRLLPQLMQLNYALEYTSSENLTTTRGHVNAMPESRGTWVPIYKLEVGDYPAAPGTAPGPAAMDTIEAKNDHILLLLENNLLGEQKKLEKQRSQAIKAHLVAQADVCQDKLNKITDCLNCVGRLRTDVRLESGGCGNCTLQALYGDAYRSTDVNLNTGQASSSVEVFSEWLKAAELAIEQNLPYMSCLIRGRGHVYTLNSINSPLLTNMLSQITPGVARLQAEHDNDVRTLLNEIKFANSPIIFIDPNWDGIDGIGLRWNSMTNSYILCGMKNNKVDRDFQLIEENKCFFEDLRAYFVRY